MAAKLAWFHFYERLNDFLPAEQKHQELRYFFNGHPAMLSLQRLNPTCVKRTNY